MSGNIKEVSVALTPADEAALSRPTRRRRGTRKAVQEGGQTEVEPVVEKQAAPAPTSQVSPQVPPQQVPQPQAPQVPPQVPQAHQVSPQVPQVPTPTQTGAGKVPAVKIQTRKRTHGLPTSTRRSMLGARILPVKRHAAIPIAKPKLIVPISEEKKTPADAKPIEAPKTTTRHVKKRRFAERRLTLSVKSEAKTRKHQRSVKRQVAAMTADDIRGVLKEKGILKPKSNPPESMLRSMMQDYLSLKTDA